ncbi:hypothetical protein AWB76_07851 [Caballeronia temeraria]|uniref:Uncharacterized protein n=1 Tax=Caballeronia temeraria TaxID=1777137 RepID=A0A158E0I2_9BURK|nr:hypothetical protein AWB76_07851 [Caballeronia temeraria]
MQTAAPNVARFDHEPVTGASTGLLLESARTNVLLNASAPEKWNLLDVTVTTDGTLAPDKSTLARKIIEGTANTVHAVSQYYTTSISTSTQWSLWVRLKPAERTVAMVMLTDSGSVDYCCADFNLPLATVGKTYGGSGAWSLKSATCIPLKDGWVECRVSGMVSSGTGVRANVYLMKADDLSRPSTGDGVSGFYFGGAQMEMGTSTSFIPTTSATTTRTNEYLSIKDTGAINPLEGTLVFDGAFRGVVGGGMFAFSLDDGVNSGIGIYKALGGGGLVAYSGGATGTSLGKTVADGERFRAAIAYSAGGASAVASINGGAPITITATKAFTPALLSIGSARSQFNACESVRSLQYWPRRLSDAELSDATRLQLTNVSATDELFGIGDGVTKSFPLTYRGVPLSAVSSASVYREDWQGKQILYSTPRTNLALNSNDLDAQTWSHYYVTPATLTKGAIGPDGTATAWSFPLSDCTGNNNNTAGLLYSIGAQIYPSGTKACVSAWLRADQPLQFRICVDDANQKILKLDTVWRAYSVSGTANGTGRAVELFMSKTDNVGVPLTAKVYIACVEAEKGATPGSYIPTKSTAVTVTDYDLSNAVVTFSAPPVAGARLTWSGGGSIVS